VCFLLAIEPPNPKCYVCADKPELVLKVDTEKVTVKEFRDDILIKQMNMVNPDVMLDGKGIIVISSEEGETECNEEKLLKEMSIVDGCILKVDDFFQNYELTITIIHKTAEREDPKFEIIADKSVLKTADAVAKLKETSSDPQPGPSGMSSNGNGSKAYESDEDDLIMVEEQPTSSAEKRKQTDLDETDEIPSSKRARIEEPAKKTIAEDEDDDLICIDDD
jgi:ubiquitin-like 1-activating enzyme E1 B